MVGAGDGGAAGAAYWFELACDADQGVVGARSTDVCFDLQHDAVVVGLSDGMIRTYDVMDLAAPYTSFKAHPSAVKQVISLGGGGLVSVSEQHVCLHGFGGAPFASAQLLDSAGAGGSNTSKTNTASTASKASTSTSQTSTNTGTNIRTLTNALALDSVRFLVGCDDASNGSSLYELDLSRLGQGGGSGRYLHKFRGAAYNAGVSLLCPTAFGSVVCGGTDGKVGMLDLRQGRQAGAAVLAHSGGVSDLDLYDRTLMTCGVTADGRVDPFVKLFDVRMAARALGVLQVPATKLRFVPGHVAKAMFVHAHGQVHTYADVHLAGNARVEQMDQIQSGGGEVTGMDVSAVGHAAVFSDSEGHVHLWTDDEAWADAEVAGECLAVNPYPEPLEEHPLSSWEAGSKRMSALEYWEDAHSDIVSQAAFLGDSFSDAKMHELEPHFLSAAMPAVLEDGLVEEKTMRNIRPELAKRAQTRQGFPGQYLETRPEEFVMNHALVFGAETAKRGYYTAYDLEKEDILGGAGGQLEEPGSPTPGCGDGAGGDDSTGGGGDGDAAAAKADKLKLEAIPERFRSPELTLSNIGLADFDFGKFNATPFAGLEANVPNSFANAVLQVLFFNDALRRALEDFVTEDANSLATEAGFLFKMLAQAQAVKSRTKSCEARNFLRAFRLAPDAAALGLLEPTQLTPDERTCAFIRFLLEQFSRGHSGIKQLVGDTFGITFSYREQWLTSGGGGGGEETERRSVSMALDVQYPPELSKAILEKQGVPDVSFCDLLQGTFNQTPKRTKLWSTKLSRQVPVVQTKAVAAFREVLIVNAASHNNRSVYLPLYRQKAQPKTEPHKPFVPTYFCATMPAGAKGGKIKVTTTPPPASAANPGKSKSKGGKVHEFDLVAVVSHVYPSNNLVAHIKVPAEYAARANRLSAAKDKDKDKERKAVRRRGSSSFAGSEVADEQWLLFNDFAVSPAEVSEVVDFRQPWRNPCLFVYKQRGCPPVKVPASIKAAEVPEERIFSAPSLAIKPPLRRTFEQLPVAKLPGKGDLVAIDCEMVALSTEESFINSEGRKVVTRQSQLSLARLSCTTADEIVFIDDYIVTPEPVVDYLTRFSGLVPGDLDPTTSVHHLVPLRTAYLKLRRLVDRGCIFVGHGLMKDFRVINIFIPPDQIMDTVHLFHMKNNRFLSLSFLASYLLDLDIQGKTHDSIEDANTALRLYKRYLEFQRDGVCEEKIREIYAEGSRRNFR